MYASHGATWRDITLHACTHCMHIMRAYVHAYITYTHARPHTCMHTCMHTCTRACMHACIHTLHTYIHTYITYITYMHDITYITCKTPHHITPHSTKSHYKKHTTHPIHATIHSRHACVHACITCINENARPHTHTHTHTHVHASHICIHSRMRPCRHAYVHVVHASHALHTDITRMHASSHVT